MTLTVEELRKFAKGKIAHYKIPYYVQVVAQLPRTVTGKVRKHLLREQGVKDYGLESADAVPTAWSSGWSATRARGRKGDGGALTLTRPFGHPLPPAQEGE